MARKILVPVLVFVFFFAFLLTPLSFTAQRIAAESDEHTIFTSDAEIHPYSSHTKCEVVQAKGRYWLFFDWVAEGQDPMNPDIFVMSSVDGRSWNGPFPVAATNGPEHSVKVVFCQGRFFVTYQLDQNLYYRTSQDGRHFSDPVWFYDAAGGGIHYVDHDIIFANDRFYLTWTEVFDPFGELFITSSPNLHDWTTPLQITHSPGLIDFTPELCWAKGKLWLFWDAGYDSTHARIYFKHSTDGIQWSDRYFITPQSDTNEYWGPFTVLFERGRFIFVTRTYMYDGPNWWEWNWRIVYTTSRDGISWTPFTPLTNPSTEQDYAEVGPTVFPLHVPGRGHSYSVIFKRHWWLQGPPHELRQISLTLY
jgi:hypothetical protein